MTAWEGQERVFGLGVALPPGGLAGWILDVTHWWRQRELRGRRQQAQRQLVIVESLSLGARRELLLVSCAGERFLVGTGAEGVQSVVRVGADRSFGKPAEKPAEKLAEERRWG